MRRLLPFAAILLLATPLCAQMMGGGGSSSGGGMMGGGGSSGGGMMGGQGSMAMGPFIAPDGTLIVTSIVAADAQSPAHGRVTAISPSGTVAWRYDADHPVMTVTFGSGSVVVGTIDATVTSALQSSVLAIGLTSGAKLWEASVDGFVTGLQAVGGRVYVTVGGSGMVNAGSMMGHARAVNPGFGMMTGNGHIVALDGNTGNVIWNVTP